MPKWEPVPVPAFWTPGAHWVNVFARYILLWSCQCLRSRCLLFYYETVWLALGSILSFLYRNLISLKCRKGVIEKAIHKGHRPTASVREAAEYKDDWIARPSPCRSQGQWEVWSEMSRQWRYTQSVTVYRQYMCLAVGSRDLPNLWQCFQTKSVPDCYHVCSDCLDQPTFQTLRKKCTNAWQWWRLAIDCLQQWVTYSALD